MLELVTLTWRQDARTWLVSLNLTCCLKAVSAFQLYPLPGRSVQGHVNTSICGQNNTSEPLFFLQRTAQEVSGHTLLSSPTQKTKSVLVNKYWGLSPFAVNWLSHSSLGVCLCLICLFQYMTGKKTQTRYFSELAQWTQLRSGESGKQTFCNDT